MGHQCWRGRSDWAITATVLSAAGEARLVESRAVPHVRDHEGLAVPGGMRNDLSRDLAKPNFSHFGTDIDGKWFITDSSPMDVEGSLYFGALGEPGKDPLRDFIHLLRPRSTWKNGAHPHPFLSPDGTCGFFNSDESGMLQAYMIKGLPAR
jgi:hypothetical protein